MDNHRVNIDKNSNQNPLISVIIPAYNAENFICEAIKSVINQDCKDYEIIIVDDGSIDQTATLIKELMSNHKMIRLVSTDNGGVSRARNIGINNAKGSFVCFLDSDDSLEPKFLSILLTQIRENNAEIQLCGYYKHYINKVELSPVVKNSDELILKYISGDTSFHVGSMLIRKNFLERNKIFFDERLSLGEDILFICMVLSLGRYSVSFDHLYHHQYREGSVTTSQWSKDDYLHDIFAMKVIAERMNDLHQFNARNSIYNNLSERVVESKTRYLWKLFLNKDFNELSLLYQSNFLDESDLIQSKKMSRRIKRRIKIISLNNVFLWKIINLLYLCKKTNSSVFS